MELDAPPPPTLTDLAQTHPDLLAESVGGALSVADLANLTQTSKLFLSIAVADLNWKPRVLGRSWLLAPTPLGSGEAAVALWRAGDADAGAMSVGELKAVLTSRQPHQPFPLEKSELRAAAAAALVGDLPKLAHDGDGWWRRLYRALCVGVSVRRTRSCRAAPSASSIGCSWRAPATGITAGTAARCGSRTDASPSSTTQGACSRRPTCAAACRRRRRGLHHVCTRRLICRRSVAASGCRPTSMARPSTSPPTRSPCAIRRTCIRSTMNMRRSRTTASWAACTRSSPRRAAAALLRHPQPRRRRRAPRKERRGARSVGGAHQRAGVLRHLRPVPLAGGPRALPPAGAGAVRRR